MVTRSRVRARSFERSELALMTSQEPVQHIARVYVVSRHSSPSVNAGRIGPMVVSWLRVGAGSIEGEETRFLPTTEPVPLLSTTWERSRESTMMRPA